MEEEIKKKEYRNIISQHMMGVIYLLCESMARNSINNSPNSLSNALKTRV